MRLLQQRSKNVKLKIQNIGIRFLNFKFLIIAILHFNIFPSTAATSEPVLTVVQSSENINQWAGITKRLEALGVKYCAISLESVKSAADWGERKVLFLPNVEMLTPRQAIALEEWMRKGGRLVASGPVGNLSAPGVRQLLRTLIGGYWGFSLSHPQKLQLSDQKALNGTQQDGLVGTVHGGVVVTDGVRARTAAVWNTQDNPIAVLVTERTTLLGWRWGADTASATELDIAWLRASINRYLVKPVIGGPKVEGAAQHCSTALATTPRRQFANARTQSIAPSKPTLTTPRRNNPSIQLKKPTSTASSTPRASSTTDKPSWLGRRLTRQRTLATANQPQPFNRDVFPKSDEAIDQLEQGVRLDIVPNAQTRITQAEVLALQQQLRNLIGRVESANLAASVSVERPQSLKTQQSTEVAVTQSRLLLPGTRQVLDQAREVAKNLSELVSEKKYTEARQQWLTAKASLLKQFPLEQRLAQPEIRAIWLDRGTIVRAGGEQKLSQLFDQIAKAGINTVFFETVNAGYTIYPSRVAPQQNPLIKGWDPLAVAVKLAHERGIELHAWVWVFAAGNQRHNQLLNLQRDYPGPVLAAHPDWAGYDQRRQMIPKNQSKPFFDPAHPEARQYLLNLFEEIATRYNVDGLQLDYIRYPFQHPNANQTYGYGKAARAQFRQLTGVDPINISPRQRHLWQKWTEFRTQQVNSFVAQVAQRLRQKRPNLILSAAVFPLNEQERLQKIQQHWEVWAMRGDIDLIVPMTYAQDSLRFERLAQPWLASTKLGSALLVPGIRLLALPTMGALDQIQLVRDLPTNGYALFAAENLHNDLLQILDTTQGQVQNPQKEPLPHRQPFQTAVIRYTQLQREWVFVAQNGQLKIPSTMLSTFNSQAETLGKTLNQLATEPKNSHLLIAKDTLRGFQAQFRVWMRLHALENPYQVKVWENRLTTIERLLQYGAR